MPIHRQTRPALPECRHPRTPAASVRSVAFAGFAGGAALLAGAGNAAAAQCPAFPTGPYAAPVSHERVTDYVETKLGGDWRAYIGQQNDRLRRLNALRAQGKPLAVRHDGAAARISGPELDHYISVTSGRIKVLRCLAGETTPSAAKLVAVLPQPVKADPAETAQASAADLNDFATAAGGTKVAAPAPQASQNPQLVHVALRNKKAQPPGPSLDVEITAVCKGDTTIFRVANKGAAFPEPGSISIYQIGAAAGRKLVRTRRMQLSEGQSATFELKKYLNATGQLGLFVEPSWYHRATGLDAAIACG